MDDIRTMYVIKDYTTNMWKVYGHNKATMTMVELFANKSQDKCDDFADDFAIAHHMYYDRTQCAYYKHSKYYSGF